MAKYLCQIDIDVYIYIAEGDKEYQYDTESADTLSEKIWKHFSELALSQERLKEVGLSAREAKKVAHKRELMEFTSLADVESIEGIAKVSLKKIKDYLNCQKCTQAELSGLASTHTLSTSVKKKSNTSPKIGRKKPNIKAEAPTEETLFTAELVS
jgi:hypothetical protein